MESVLPSVQYLEYKIRKDHKMNSLQIGARVGVVSADYQSIDDIDLAEVYPHVSIRKSIEAYPDKVAIVWDLPNGQREILTYREYGNVANQLAGSLVNEHQLQKGDRIACRFRHGPEYLITYLACCLTGIIFMPLSDEFDAATVQSRIERSGAKAYLTHSLASPLRLPRMNNVVIIDLSRLCDNKKQQSEFESVEHLPRDICFSYGSSGTTKQPKIINLPYESELLRIGGINRVMNITHENVIGNLMQDGFDAGLCLALMSLYAGATLRILDVNILRNAATHLNEIWERDLNYDEDYQYIPDVLILLPQILKAIDLNRLNGRRIKIIVTGSELNPLTAEGLLGDARFKGELYNAYGPTEGRWGMSICKVMPGYQPYIETNRSSMGLESFLVHRSDDGEIRILEGNVRGEIAFTGRGIGEYQEACEDSKNFLSAEEAREKGISSERVYFTGDLGERSDSGILYKGRLNWMLKFNGQKVLLSDIENEIRNILPEILHDVVVTASNNKSVAFLQSADMMGGRELRNEIFKALLTMELKHRPSYVFLIDNIPYTDGPKGRIANRSLDVILTRSIRYLNSLGLESTYSLVEKELKILWRECLAHDIDYRLKEYIDFPLTSTLSELGVDSISRAFLYKTMFDKFFPGEFSFYSRKWQEFYSYVRTDPQFKDLAYYIEIEKNLSVIPINNPGNDTYYLYFHLGELNASEQLESVENFQCWQIQLPSIHDNESVNVLAMKLKQIMMSKQLQGPYVIGASSEAGLKCMIRLKELVKEQNQPIFCIFREDDIQHLSDEWKDRCREDMSQKSVSLKQALDIKSPWIIYWTMMDKIDDAYRLNSVNSRFELKKYASEYIHKNGLGPIKAICNHKILNRIDRTIHKSRITVFHGDSESFVNPLLYYCLWKWFEGDDAVRKQERSKSISPRNPLPIYITLSGDGSEAALSDQLERRYGLNRLERLCLWGLPTIFCIVGQYTTRDSNTKEWAGNKKIEKIVLMLKRKDGFNFIRYGYTPDDISQRDLSISLRDLHYNFPPEIFQQCEKLGLNPTLKNLSIILSVNSINKKKGGSIKTKIYYITLIRWEYERNYISEFSQDVILAVNNMLSALYKEHSNNDLPIMYSELQNVDYNDLVLAVLNYDVIREQYSIPESLKRLLENKALIEERDNIEQDNRRNSHRILSRYRSRIDYFIKAQAKQKTTLVINKIRTSSFGHQVVILYPVTGLIPRSLSERFTGFQNSDVVVVEMSPEDTQPYISMKDKATEVLSKIDIHRKTTIIGYSFGGYLGYEMIRVLESMNYEIDMQLVLVDTPPPNFLEKIDWRFALYHLLVSLSQILEIGIDSSRLRELFTDGRLDEILDFEELVNTVFDRSLIVFNQYIDLMPYQLNIIFNVRRNIISAYQYDLELYPDGIYSSYLIDTLVENKVILFCADKTDGLWINRDGAEIQPSEWGRYIRNIILKRVSGHNHYSIIDVEENNTFLQYLNDKFKYSTTLLPLMALEHRLDVYRNKILRELEANELTSRDNVEWVIERRTMREVSVIQSNPKLMEIIATKILQGNRTNNNPFYPEIISVDDFIAKIDYEFPYSWIRQDSMKGIETILFKASLSSSPENNHTLFFHLVYQYSIRKSVEEALYRNGITVPELFYNMYIKSFIIFLNRIDYTEENFDYMNFLKQKKPTTQFFIPYSEEVSLDVKSKNLGAKIYGAYDGAQYRGSIFFRLENIDRKKALDSSQDTLDERKHDSYQPAEAGPANAAPNSS